MARGRNSRPEEVQKDKKIRKHIKKPAEWMMKFGDSTFVDERIPETPKTLNKKLNKKLTLKQRILKFLGF